VKFLVDMPLSPALGRWLETQGHDAVHASALSLNRASDADIIARAALEGRIIVTADLDYPRLLALTGATGPGLILFRGGDWSDAEIFGRMSDVLRSLGEAELAQSILVIERERLRRRRLPIQP
jgi:predicted nuclease of predicted toxin-antitoxin system